MIFASRVQKTIPIPNDPPHEVMIQKLPRRHFIAAEKAQQAEVMGDLRKQFGDDWQDQIRKFKTDDNDEAVVKAARDPLLKFDVPELLKHGVKAWTCVDEDGKPIDVNDDTLADLDKETAEYLAREVLRLSAPKLFETEEGEAQKNAYASSGAA